jgi:FMN phosphatase YigB (HAD superfamily)
MATVYSRVMELQDEGRFPFVFNPKRIPKVCRIIRDHWEKSHDYIPPLVESIEITGVYQVIDYPSEFIAEMDMQIFEYVNLVSELREKKAKKAENQLFSSSPTPIKRKRKRLPGRPEFRMSKTG